MEEDGRLSLLVPQGNMRSKIKALWNLKPHRVEISYEPNDTNAAKGFELSTVASPAPPPVAVGRFHP